MLSETKNLLKFRTISASMKGTQMYPARYRLLLGGIKMKNRKPRKFLLSTVLALGISLTTPSGAIGHGGGLDWQGGHNCRVGSCAGTYHCHQARGGVCAPKLKTPSKAPSKSKTKNP